MKIYRKSKSMHTKLMLSFLSIILITSIVFGSLVIFFVERNFRNEVEAQERKALVYLENVIQNQIVDRIELLYINNLWQNEDIMYFVDNNLDENYMKIQKINSLVLNIAANYSDILSAIHIYYPKNSLVVSSLYGYKSLSKNDPLISTKLWAKDDIEINLPGLWYVEDEIDINGERTVNYIKYAPFNIEGDLLRVVFSIKSSAFEAVFDDFISQNNGQSLIVDADGTIFYHSDSNLIGTKLDEKLFSLIQNDNDNNEKVIKLDGEKYVLNYGEMKNPKCKIVNFVPTSEFYNNALSLTKLLILICVFVVILLGLLSRYFVRFTYLPLKTLIDNIKSSKYNNEGNIELEATEYDFIQSFVNNLESKTSSLDTILKNNDNIIKNNLLGRLIKGIDINENLLKLNEIDICFEKSHFAVMFIELDSLGFTNIESANFVKSQIIKLVENLSTDEAVFMGCELSEDRIGVIINTELSSFDFNELAECIVEDIGKYYSVSIHISTGSLYENVENISNSFNDAKITTEYFYIFSEKSVLSYNDIKDRENSQRRLSYNVVRKIDASLNERDSYKTRCILDEYLNEMKNELYSYAEFNYHLMGIVSALSTFAREVKFNSDDEKRFFNEEFQYISNVDQLVIWFMNYVESIMDFLNFKTNNKALATINYVKTYLDEHYGEDATLDKVAEKVGLSPKYLSSLFIQEEGISYTNYLTAQRMRKAKYLLLETDLPISEISNLLGYLTPSYFIKIFKKTYSETPVNFRKIYK